MDKDIEHYKKSFFDTAVADILRAMDGRSLVGSFILTLCLIDYLVYLTSHVDKPGEMEYEDFVRDSLCALGNYDPEWMRSLRNALAHTYGKSYKMKEGEEKRGNDGKEEKEGKKEKKVTKGYRLTHLRPKLHLKQTDKITFISLESFVTDVVWCAWEVFYGLQAKSNGMDTIEKRLGELLVITITGSDPISYEYRLFKSMHRALRVFDKEEPNRAELYKDIEQILIDK